LQKGHTHRERTEGVKDREKQKAEENGEKKRENWFD
jgi:hypothetical protein